MANVLTYEELLTGGGGISRRKFIKGVGAAVAGGALLAIAGQTLLSALPQVPGSALVRSTFAKHVGDVFQVYQGSAAAPALRLADVRDLPAPASDQKERSFSLLFTGPIDPMIAQGMYRFEHHEIGAFSMFIVPMAPAAGARYYEAIFNR